MQKPSGLKGMCIGLIMIEFLIFYVRAAILHIYSYVPASGCIAPAVYRSPVGLLLAYWGSLGDPVRARGGHLQLHGGSLPAAYPLPRPLHWGETGPILG